MIELNFHKVIDQHFAINIDALTVQPGEIAALVGAVGSGREALFALLLGQSRPTAGTIRLAGSDPAADKQAFSRQVGVLFAEDSLYKNQSAQANLLFHCRLHGLPKGRAGEVLTEVGLADHAYIRVDRLSSGLARRLAFGRAILHKPRVLLLDEPFARCDETSMLLLGRMMRQLAADEVALLILAGDEANLSALCDTMHVLEHGRVVKTFKPQEEQRAALPFKIPVRLEDRVVLVNPADILYVEAQDERACLHTLSEQLPTQFTVTELEERLARSGFFRAHRGYLVNLQRVREVVPYTRNSFSLILDDAAGTEIPLSKSAAGELRELLGY